MVNNIHFVNTPEPSAHVDSLLHWALLASRERDSKLHEVIELKALLAESYSRSNALQDSLQHLPLSAPLTFLPAGAAGVSRALMEAVRQEERTAALVIRRGTLQAQLDEGHEVLRRAAQMVDTAQSHLADEAREAEQELIEVRRKLRCVDDVTEELGYVRDVLEEQCHELRALNATIAAVDATTRGHTSPQPDISQQQIIVTAQATFPIPAGGMRFVTGASGIELQRLREKHGVAAAIVPVGQGLAVKVVGHQQGVHDATADIRDRIAGGGL